MMVPVASLEFVVKTLIENTTDKKRASVCSTFPSRLQVWCAVGASRVLLPFGGCGQGRTVWNATSAGGGVSMRRDWDHLAVHATKHNAVVVAVGIMLASLHEAVPIFPVWYLRSE